MRYVALALLSVLTIILAACSPVAPTPAPPAAASQIPPQPPQISTEPAQTGAGDMTRADMQGAVTVEITPLNLDSANDTLDFDVVMDTHSIDLSMDLATLASLTTDTGVTVPAAQWDAPLGGHHVAGKLIFPAVEDGKPILDGASKLTLTILNVDVPARIFAWELK